MINRKRILAFCLSLSMIFQAAVPVIPVSASEIQEMDTEEYDESESGTDDDAASDEGSESVVVSEVEEDAGTNETDSKLGTDDDAVSDEESAVVSEDETDSKSEKETETETEDTDLSESENEEENESDIMSSDNEEQNGEDSENTTCEAGETETDDEQDTDSPNPEKESPEENITDDIQEIVTYTITYILDGGTNDPSNPDSFMYDEVYPVSIKIADPVKENYKFCGWYTDADYNNAFTGADTSHSGSIVLYAKWEFEGPTIEFKYELDGGTNSDQNPQIETVQLGKNNSFKIYVPRKLGYVFKGWYTERRPSGSGTDEYYYSGKLQYADSSNSVSLYRVYPVTEKTEVTLYAKWEQLSYTIKISGFDYYYQTYSNIKYTQEFTFPSGDRDGYYVKYKLESNGKEYTEGDKASKLTTVNKDVVYVDANYCPITYKLTYDYAGGVTSGELPKSWTIETNSSFPAPQKKGYIFNGWRLNNTDTYIYSLYDLINVVKFDDGYNHPTANVSLKAAWHPISYQVNLIDPENRMQTKTLYMSYDKADRFGEKGYILNGYKLIKWSDKKTGDDGTEYEAGNEILNLTDVDGQVLNFYARWEAQTYNITYELDGGTNNANAPTQYTTGKGTGTLPSPVKPGYTFKGWYKDAQHQEQVTKIQKESFNDIKLYAAWQPNVYNVTFNPNGSNATGTINTIAMTYDQEYVLPKNVFERPGYTFAGWNTSATGKGDTYSPEQKVKNLTERSNVSITFYCMWTPNTNKIVYELNGGTNHESNKSTYMTGDLTYLYKPTKPGYTFDGWYTDAEFKNTVSSISTSSFGDITLYAKWSPITYSISFNKNASSATGEMEKIGAIYDQDAAMPECAYTYPGHRFVGWNTSANGSGTTFKPGDKAKNLTETNGRTVALYAQWKSNDYEITYMLDGGTNNSKNPATYKGGSSVKLYSATKDGYVFDGWYTDPEFNNKITVISKINDDVTIYAKWSDIQFNIVFNANGGSGKMTKQQNVTLKTLALTKNTFTKQGYTFAGWNSSKKGDGISFTDGQDTFSEFPSVKNKGTVTLYAQWYAPTFNISYELDGGNNDSSNPATYNAAKDVTLKNPTKAGYTFKGWYKDPQFTTKLSKISKTTGSDVTVYAKWQANAYTITFNANGGKGKMSSIKTTAPETVSLTGNVYTRPGYVFAGWNTSKKGDGTPYEDGSDYSNINAKPSSTVTLYAQWYTPTYNITYELNGGENNSSNPSTYNVTKDVTLKNPVRTGYTFAGWYKDPQFTTKLTKISKTTGNDITVYAKWQANAYTITFNANGGKGKMASIKTTAPETISLTSNVYTRPGYVFAGWNTSKKGDGTPYEDGSDYSNINAKPSSTITLYAQWYTPTYNITYELNGGENNSSNPSTYNVTKDVTLKNPTRTGYTFAGWYKDPQFTTKLTKINKTTGSDITVYAKWQANAYTIAFNANGGKGKMSSIKGTSPVEITLPENTFTRSGYTFAGWSMSKKGTDTVYEDGETLSFPEVKNNAVITLYVQWYTPSYTIRYDLDGGENNSANPETYNATKDVTLKNPTKPGYTFKGWYKDSQYKTKITKISKTTGKDIVVFAKWQVNTYTISFNANGGKGKMTALKGTAPEPIALSKNTFIRSGYTFAGWNTSKKGTGTSYSDEEVADFINVKNGAKITLYAQWEKE